MAKPPLIFSGPRDPGALFITKCCSASPSWDQVPVDRTGWSALDPHTSTSVLVLMPTVFTSSLFSGSIALTSSSVHNAASLPKSSLCLLLWLSVTRFRATRH